MEDVISLREAEQRVPQQIKEFIRRQFGQGREGDRVMLAFVNEGKTKRRIERIFNERKKQIEKMADLRSSNDSLEEISSSQERSNRSLPQPAGDEYEEEKVPRQDDVPKDMPVRMEVN